jgi:ATP-binding cassette subfamily F protein 3
LSNMLSLSSIRYGLAGRALLEDASCIVRRGEKVGFFGRNGTGKTTLFRLIKGDIAAESGTIELDKRARIGSVEQEAPSGPEALLDIVLKADRERASLLEQAQSATDAHDIADIQTRLADIDAHSAEARASRILSGLGFSYEAQKRASSDFSGGWRMRVALAAILFSSPDLLLLDEPTNYLDLEGTLWLQDYLKRYPHTFIMISHDRDLLNTSVTSILHLEQRKLSMYRGTYDSFVRQRAEKLRLQGKMQSKQDAKRKHMEAFVERFRAKATKAKQAQSRLKMLEKMEKVDVFVEQDVKPFLFPNPAKVQSPPLIRLEDVSVGYEPDKPILKRLNLRIDPDDRIGLLGSNGNGKSTFAKLLAGDLVAESGAITTPSKMDVAFFAQHQLDKLRPAESPVEHVRSIMAGQPESKVRARTAQMGLDIHRMDTPAQDLSGGERARLLLGLVAFHGPHLLILDEPTNHLDVDSREALAQALQDYEGAVILISHDRHLLEATADRLWLVDSGGVNPFEGDLEDYQAFILGRAKPSEISKQKEDAKKAKAEKAKPAVSVSVLKDKLVEAEKRIEAIKAELARIDKELTKPGLFAHNPEKAAKLSRRRSEGTGALVLWEEKWLELAERLEDA